MRTLEEVVKSVADERLIKIIVGCEGEEQTFHLQQTLFETTSPVFAAALRNAHLGGGERDVVYYPEDAAAAFEVLIFWLVEGELPEEVKWNEEDEQQEFLLVQSWCLGGRYDIPVFQDLIMLEYMSLLDRTHLTPKATAYAVDNTPPESLLRLLISRVLVQTMNDNEKTYDWEDFSEALDVAGFGLEVLVAQRKLAGNIVSFFEVGDKEGSDRTDMWKEYMVSDGPAQHWILNDDRDA